MELEQKNYRVLLNDQLFLVNFIMGTYLGPDVAFDNPRCSIVQRLTENSPPYTSNDLGPSYLSVALLENLYYYLLRKACPSLVLKLSAFHKYLRGSIVHLPESEPESRQFTSFFPSCLHKQVWNPASFRVVRGIVLFDDPLITKIDERDLERFKSLTCVDGMKIDLHELVNFEHEYRIGSGFDNGSKRRRHCVEDMGQESEVSIVVTGTARRGRLGPPVGVVDVGVSKVAYYFRVALPGVRKDYCKFSCEIESEGKVHVRGLAGGGKTIEKPSRVFEMKFRQLCPPGPFTVSFCLPGPVDPRLFAPNFRPDGIFEGVIIKHPSNVT